MLRRVLAAVVLTVVAIGAAPRGAAAALVPSFSLNEGTTGAPRDNQYEETFSAVEIRGLKGSLTSSETGIPLAYEWVPGQHVKGTGAFSLQGTYDAATGAVTGTFTYQNTATGTITAPDAPDGEVLDEVLIWSGDVTGTIGSETASLSFKGTYSGKCTFTRGKLVYSCFTYDPTATNVIAVTFKVQVQAEDATEAPCVDEGTRFSSVSGQVEVAHEGPVKKNWHFAKMKTVLCVDDHVKTFEDSTAIISFENLSTFLVKPETEVVLNSLRPKISKIGLVLGYIWANVKNLAKDGTMEIDMSQAVAGIKGTTFVLGETGSTSTLKVIEGTVAFTAKATGQTLEVSTGQAAQADGTGLSPVTSFDVNAESADWAKIGAGTTAATTGTGTAAADSSLPVALLAGLVVVLLVAGVIRVVRRRG